MKLWHTAGNCCPSYTPNLRLRDSGHHCKELQRLDTVPVSINVAKSQSSALLPAQVVLGERTFALLCQHSLHTFIDAQLIRPACARSGNSLLSEGMYLMTVDAVLAHTAELSNMPG